MTMMQIKDILYDKRKVDKLNSDLENKITRESKGLTDSDSKEKQIDAEKEQIKKLQNALAFQRNQSQNIMERLKEEEQKGKLMLDLKIKLA